MEGTKGGGAPVDFQINGGLLYIYSRLLLVVSQPRTFFFLCWCLSAQLLLVVAPPYRAQSFLQTRFTSAIQIGAPSTHTP
jgi:hypothetical protein